MGCAEGRSPFAGSLRVSLRYDFSPLPGQGGGLGVPPRHQPMAGGWVKSPPGLGKLGANHYEITPNSPASV